MRKYASSTIAHAVTQYLKQVPTSVLIESSNNEEPELDRIVEQVVEASFLLSEIYRRQDQIDSIDKELRVEKNAAEYADNRYKRLYDTSPIGYLTLDKSKKITELNLAASRLLGVDISSAIGKKFSLFVVQESKVVFTQALKRSINEIANITLRLENLRYEVLTVKTQLVWTSDSECLVSLTDVSELYQVKELALRDPLTQLANRRLLDDRLQQVLNYSSRNNSYLAVIIIDLDNFKPINDTYGHLAGDLLLKELAFRLRHAVRESDTVARLGGDEFVAVLSLTIDLDQSKAYVKSVAEKLRQSLSTPCTLELSSGTVKLSCTASIGISLVKNKDFLAEEVIRAADRAMYRSKKLGGDTISFFNSEDFES